MKKISEKGINLIKKWESFRSKPYLDASGTPTIGYGNTFYTNGKKVTMQDAPITQAQGENLLKEVVKSFENAVNQAVKVHLNQSQFDALVSLCYNIGAGAFQRSTLLKIINQNPDNEEIIDEFMRFVYSKGQKLRGLENRRKEEVALYFSSSKKKVTSVFIY